MAYVTGTALDLSTPRFYNLTSSNWVLSGGGGIGGILHPSDIYWAQASGTLLNIDQEGVPAGKINLNTPVSAFTEWSKAGVPFLSVSDINVPLNVTKYGDFSSGFSAQLNISWSTILAGNDSIIGTGRLYGYGGDDRLRGQWTPDILDGGTGSDTAEFKLAKSDYQIMVAPDQRVALWPYKLYYGDPNGDGLDVLSNVEVVQFTDGKISYPFLGTVEALEYVASYSDLMGTFGTNVQAGFDHFVGRGYFEGRTPRFDGLEYAASYPDLMNTFGANADAGASHYITNGHFEGRTTSFDGLEYIASYSDLMNAFGTNQDTGTSHYITTGRFEGRQATFDGLEYIASYSDLMNAFAFGTNQDAGTSHYITTGRFEGRQATFDGLEYIASYSDLMNAFGTNQDAGTAHFITNGRFEARTSSFDGLQYIASYGDLIQAFNANSDAGSSHYITNGRYEGRAPDTFDAAQYLNNYSDLQAAFGTDLEAATLHYIQSGYFEGRVDDVI